jgi:hypothetical protein
VSNPRPGPITPTKLAQNRTTLTLPGSVTAVGRGGNGRFLLLRTPSQILVFDPNEGALGTPFRFERQATNLVFAAGASKLFVHYLGKLERYNLDNREFETAVAWPNAPDALVIGSGSDGPLFALRGREAPRTGEDQTEVTVIDPEGLTALGTLTVDRVRAESGRRAGVRVSADGGVVGIGAETNRSGMVLRFLPGPDPNIRGRFEPIRLVGDSLVGHIAPSPDGRFVYTTRGVFRSDGQPLLGLAKSEQFFYTLPTAHGSDLFVSLDVGATSGNIAKKVQLHLAGEQKPVDEFGEVLGPVGMGANDVENIPADLRVHAWPAAGVVAVLPANTSQLDVYKVDIRGMLRDSGRPHLLFGSDPPTFAVRGKMYTYTPEVWSSSPLKIGLRDAPPGMQFDGRQLVWAVPDDYNQGDVEVRIAANDGQRTAAQQFRIVVLDP